MAKQASEPMLLQESTDRLENALAVQLEGVPAHVRMTLLLGVLERQLEAYGRDIPVGLLPLLDCVSKTHAVYVRLCTEGLEPVS